MNQLVQSFLDYLKYERNYSDCTIVSYTADLKYFEEFSVRMVGSFEPLSPDLNLVRGWMAEMGKRHMAVTGIKRRLCCLRSFYRFLRRQNLIETNPLSLLPSPKVPKPLPVWVSESQMDYLIDNVDYGQDFEGIRDHLLIVLLYSTGMRRSEAAGLKDTDVDFGAKQLKVKGKGNKERLIPFGQELSELMSQYLDRRNAELGFYPSSFLTDIEGKPLTPAQVTSIAHKYLEQIPQLARKGAHVLRHSFATNMLAEGADLMAVKEILGHASLQSTEVYTHLTPKDIIDNYKQAHPRAK